MGFGDAIMAAGQAQALFDQQPSAGPVMICDVANVPRWHYLWEGNPVIAHPKPGECTRDPFIRTGKGCLPYIRYPWTAETGWQFVTDWRAQDYRAKYYPTDDEQEFTHATVVDHGPYVVIEPPSTKRNINRRGSLDLWIQLVPLLRRAFGFIPVQLAHEHAVLLPNVRPIAHAHMRQAAAVLAGASLIVTVEGGLAHLASVFSIPTVVLWGGTISAAVLGYPEHANLADPSAQTPCGSFYPCDHCAAAWRRYTPEQVLDAARRLLHLSS